MRLDDFVNILNDKIIQKEKTIVQFTDCQDVNTVSEQQLSVNHLYSDIKGSYTQVYFPWIYNTDLDERIRIPQSYEVLKKQYVKDPWVPIQGINHGGIINQDITENRLIDSQQDYLSDRNINSLRYFPYYTPSTIIFEEKTHYDKLSALQRLTQRRTAISIELSVSKQMRQFLFEPLVEQTFVGIQSKQSNIMDEYVTKQQIYEYKIHLDTSLQLLDNNMVLLTVYFKPMKYLEFVELFFYVRSYQQGVGEEYNGESVQ